MTDEKTLAFRAQVADQSMNYIAAALGLVAGLAWNDAVKALIDYLFPVSEASIAAKFGYAIIMTLVVIVLTLILKRILGAVRPKA